MWQMALFLNISKLLCFEQIKVNGLNYSLFSILMHTSFSIKTSEDIDKSLAQDVTF